MVLHQTIRSMVLIFLPLLISTSQAISFYDLQEFHLMTDKFHYMPDKFHLMPEPTEFHVGSGIK